MIFQFFQRLFFPLNEFPLCERILFLRYFFQLIISEDGSLWNRLKVVPLRDVHSQKHSCNQFFSQSMEVLQVMVWLKTPLYFISLILKRDNLLVVGDLGHHFLDC